MTTTQQIIDRLKRVASIIQLDALIAIEKNRTGVKNRSDELLALLILLEEKLKEDNNES